MAWEKPRAPHAVITSVNPPTPAARAWAGLAGFRLVVAGDAKSPEDWSLGGGRAEFLSLADQASMGARCERLLPKGHYCRKNAAYIQAVRNGADLVVDTDDDNAPLGDLRLPPFSGRFDAPKDGDRWVNVYRYFTDAKCWPRGLPLDVVNRDPPPLAERRADVGVWQGLVDGEPDVDAIYRMTNGGKIAFRARGPVVLDGSQWCPTNSQNTSFPPDSFPLLYLPFTVSFRFTDILRGLVMQRALGLRKKCVGFHAATARQERNEHDLMEDFESEIPCHLHARRVPGIVGAAMRGTGSLEDDLLEGYRALARAGVVQEAELPCLEAWLADMDDARRR